MYSPELPPEPTASLTPELIDVPQESHTDAAMEQLGAQEVLLQTLQQQEHHLKLDDDLARVKRLASGLPLSTFFAINTNPDRRSAMRLDPESVFARNTIADIRQEIPGGQSDLSLREVADTVVQHYEQLRQGERDLVRQQVVHALESAEPISEAVLEVQEQHKQQLVSTISGVLRVISRPGITTITHMVMADILAQQQLYRVLPTWVKQLPLHDVQQLLPDDYSTALEESLVLVPQVAKAAEDMYRRNYQHWQDCDPLDGSETGNCLMDDIPEDQRAKAAPQVRALYEDIATVATCNEARIASTASHAQGASDTAKALFSLDIAQRDMSKLLGESQKPDAIRPFGHLGLSTMNEDLQQMSGITEPMPESLRAMVAGAVQECESEAKRQLAEEIAGVEQKLTELATQSESAEVLEQRNSLNAQLARLQSGEFKPRFE